MALTTYLDVKEYQTIFSVILASNKVFCSYIYMDFFCGVGVKTDSKNIINYKQYRNDNCFIVTMIQWCDLSGTENPDN